MKFIVSSSYLLKQLQVLGSVINSSNTLPILDNFLFELDNNRLIVSASDLETTMSATLEIDSTSQGSVAVPAKLLLEILKTFPEQPLTFTVEENSTIEISSNSGKYALAYAPGDEFPKSVILDDPSSTVVPAEVLATAISKTTPTTYSGTAIRIKNWGFRLAVTHITKNAISKLREWSINRPSKSNAALYWVIRANKTSDSKMVLSTGSNTVRNGLMRGQMGSR